MEQAGPHQVSQTHLSEDKPLHWEKWMKLAKLSFYLLKKLGKRGGKG